VSNYIQTATQAGLLPKTSLFNATGRAYPDISLLGGTANPYCVSVHQGGDLIGVAGTSASTPVASALVAHLNNLRLLKGKPQLGWVNPFFYAHPECFNDIEDKSQNNCVSGTTGFAALPGWDPASGLGTPIFSCLAKFM
jgi:tripeptidyl-peptidase-1